jgi:hypothetical protein
MGDLRLDHVILLLPYDMLANPPSWITDNFTVSPGGRHGDNKTENRLILFRDGTYLELIAFINDDPEKRKGHWWDKPFGVVDYAYTTTKLDHDGIVGRLKDRGLDLSYGKPRSGGRLLPDGREVNWEVTFPKGISRGNIPFFCTDVTPRERRVPITEANTTHPCGALGMAGMLLEVDEGRLRMLSKASAAILDQRTRDDHTYAVKAPNAIQSLNEGSIKLQNGGSGSSESLKLTLRLQTENHAPRDAVREDVQGGAVSITFE